MVCDIPAGRDDPKARPQVRPAFGSPQQADQSAEVAVSDDRLRGDKRLARVLLCNTYTDLLGPKLIMSLSPASHGIIAATNCN